MSHASEERGSCPTCGAPTTDGTLGSNCPGCLFALGADGTVEFDLDEQESIGPYRLIEPLGRGGMGVVYLAEQSAPIRRHVALKLIKLGMDTREVLARFDIERQALAILDHPNVARVHDAGATAQGRPYFVMERIDGPPLHIYCEREKLSIPARLELFLPVCEAIEHAHRKGLLHRDIKPSNVLVATIDGEPQPKVIDFGVARAIDPAGGGPRGDTIEGRILGTPEYMSPEQLAGGAVDTRSDVYSLGVLLYELLTGRLPFDPGTPRCSSEALRRRIETEAPELPSRAAARTGAAAGRPVPGRRFLLPAELDWIVMKAIDRDPDRRYASAREFAEDVRRHLRGEPVLAGSPGALYRLRKFARRHAVPVAIGAVLVLGLVAGSIIASIGLVRARRAEAQSARVAAFFAEMLAAVDPERAGAALRSDLRARVEESRPSDTVGDSDVAAALASFDDLVAPLSMTDVGRTMIDEEILKRAAVAIDERFPDEPQLAARLHHTLGDTYDQLGMHADAETQLLRALDLFPPDHPDRLRARVDLGWALVHLGRMQEAEHLALALLDQRRTVEALNLYGWILAELGRFEEAETVVVVALRTGKRLYGVEHAETQRAMNTLGLVYFRLGRLDDAERVVRDTIAVYEQHYGPDHMDTLTRKGNLAILLNKLGRYEEAVALFLETIEGLERTIGRTHRETLRNRGNLANMYGRMERYDRAAEIYRENLAAQLEALGPDHPHTLLTRRNIATVALRQKRNDEAERLFLDVLEAQRRVLGDDHFEVKESLVALATIETRRGRTDRALDLLEKAAATGHLDPARVRDDPDLAALAGHPRFDGIAGL